MNRICETSGFVISYTIFCIRTSIIDFIVLTSLKPPVLETIGPSTKRSPFPAHSGTSSNTTDAHRYSNMHLRMYTKYYIKHTSKNSMYVGGRRSHKMSMPALLASRPEGKPMLSIHLFRRHRSVSVWARRLVGYRAVSSHSLRLRFYLLCSYKAAVSYHCISRGLFGFGSLSIRVNFVQRACCTCFSLLIFM